MTDDASLSEFTAETDSDTDDEAVGSEPETESPEGDDVSGSALSTYAWGDHECERCGDDSERVWRDEDAFVCPDCKEW
ncbi:DUF7573 domain-containing protein [Natronobacterium texcoconense]|uniref:DUF7573 domain-containing protein n=1 Tax=Natronobacterium texcoconense TaxID=1095778 RepID=A0A1H1IQX4_NATTX|nr:hypothetical protein [Natronobacterium texcoconense]SDR39698.1 hypothetical protein SAMN04489842_3702 [Natronobacterium texcoconense]